MEITSNLHLKANKIRKYEEISVITNKRLIQKSYNIFKIDYLNNPISDLDSFKINRDMVFVDLESIQVVSTEQMEIIYQVGFKFNDDDKNFIPLLFTFPINKFHDFINILSDNIPLNRKVRKSNNIINYYRN